MVGIADRQVNVLYLHVLAGFAGFVLARHSGETTRGTAVAAVVGNNNAFRTRRSC